MNRLSAAVALEVRVELRYRIAVVALVMTVVWCVALLAMPAWLARGAGSLVLTVDTATFGSFFIAALFLFERGEGALAALSVSPLRFREYLGVRVAALTALSVASAIPIGLAAGRGHVDLVLIVVAVALLSALFLLLNFALVVRHRTLTGFLTVAPLPLVPLIAVPLAHLAGLAEHPLFRVVPTTGAVDVLRAAVDPTADMPAAGLAAAIGYLLLAVVAAALTAKWSYDREFTQPGRAHARRDRRIRTLRHPGTASAGDSRAGSRRRAGSDPRARRAAASFSVAVLALVMLLVTVPISGLADWRPSMLSALVLAAAQAPLITLATAAFAGNKVEGIAMLKVLGAIPTGIAPAMWWLAGPAAWPLMLLPPYWAVDVLWRPNIVGVLVGVLLTSAAITLLAHRALSRLTAGAESLA